jgi:hypothetical protein
VRSHCVRGSAGTAAENCWAPALLDAFFPPPSGANRAVGLAALEVRERAAVLETMIFPPRLGVEALSSESSCPELLTLRVLPAALTDELTLRLDEV